MYFCVPLLDHSIIILYIYLTEIGVIPCIYHDSSLFCKATNLRDWKNLLIVIVVIIIIDGLLSNFNSFYFSRITQCMHKSVNI